MCAQGLFGYSYLKKKLQRTCIPDTPLPHVRQEYSFLCEFIIDLFVLLRQSVVLDTAPVEVVGPSADVGPGGGREEDGLEGRAGVLEVEAPEVVALALEVVAGEKVSRHSEGSCDMGFSTDPISSTSQNPSSICSSMLSMLSTNTAPVWWYKYSTPYISPVYCAGG